MALFFKLTGPNVPEWFSDEIEPRKESAKAEQHGGECIFHSKYIVDDGEGREHQKRKTAEASCHEQGMLKAHRGFRRWSQERKRPPDKITVR